MLATAVNLPTRRAPSSQIRARDTSLDGTTNGSAGINSAPNVDAGINGATHLGGQRCGRHEDRDSTDYRKLAEARLAIAGRRQAHGEHRTFAWLARYGHIATHHARELARDGKAEAGSAVAARGET